MHFFKKGIIFRTQVIEKTVIPIFKWMDSGKKELVKGLRHLPCIQVCIHRLLTCGKTSITWSELWAQIKSEESPELSKVENSISFQNIKITQTNPTIANLIITLSTWDEWDTIHDLMIKQNCYKRVIVKWEKLYTLILAHTTTGSHLDLKIDKLYQHKWFLVPEFIFVFIYLFWVKAHLAKVFYTQRSLLVRFGRKHGMPDVEPGSVTYKESTLSLCLPSTHQPCSFFAFPNCLILWSCGHMWAFHPL